MPTKACLTRESINLWIQGSVPESEGERIAAHLDDCPPCETVVEQMESAGTLNLGDDSGTEPKFVAEPQCQAFVAALQAFKKGPSSRASDVEDPMPGRRIRDYELLERLGQGAMGAVYKARHSRLNKLVAMKLIAPTAVESNSANARFQREMQAVGQLHHPNVVQALDAGEDHGIAFLVMEMVDGVDLASLVARGGVLDVPEACEIGRQAAAGLHYAHTQGMVHRDVKPSNLMLSIDPEGKPCVKVLDMGLAMIASLEEGPQLTGDGQLMGTLEFMAPEQAENTRTVDHRADIYALGATLFRLLTGQVPFSGPEFSTPVQRLRALMDGAAPRIADRKSGLPESLCDLIDQMLSRQPDDRPQSLAQVVDALKPLGAGARLNGLLAPPIGTEQAHEKTAAPENDVRTVASGQHIAELALEETGEQLHELTETAIPAKPEVPAIESSQPQVTPKPGKSKDGAGVNIQRWALTATLAALPLLLLATVVMFLQTPHGTVRIEISDPSIEVAVSGDNRFRVKGKDGEFEITPGKHTLLITKGDTEFRTKEFTVVKGDVISLSVKLLDGKTIQVTQAAKAFDKHSIPTKNQNAAVASNNPHSRVITKPIDRTQLSSRIKAAKAILAKGGEIKAKGDGPGFELKSVEDVPEQFFAVIEVTGKMEVLEDIAPFNAEITYLSLKGDLSLKQAEQLARFPQLKTLHLGEGTTTNASLQGLSGCKTLTAVRFGRYNLPVEGLTLPYLPALEELNFFHGPVKSLKSALTNLPALQFLDLFHVRLDDDGLDFTSPPQSLKKLRIDDGVQTDACLAYIRKIKTLRSLEIVNTEITRAGIDALRKQLPKCQINYGETYNTREILPPVAETP